MRQHSVIVILFLGITASASAATAAPSASRPNIVYIMSDDMGFSDIGCYGSEIETPHLDRLAANGLRFTQFYNTARCCPTRACLLTGLYPHQAGIGHMMNDRGHDGYRGDLNRQCVTIPEALKSAGYKSYMAGKWHVTKVVAPKSEEDKHNWPRQRGFDRFYGTIHGAGNFFDPNTLTRDNNYISPFADPQYNREQWPNGEYYYTDAIADHAATYIRDHHRDDDDKPFFLYVAFTAAHWPMHALPRHIRKYEGRYDGGYQAVRDARYERMLKLGLIQRDNTVNWPIPEDWQERDHWDWDKRNMEVYAAMIDCMDEGIGRIVAALRETGQLDNTLLCFFQDNGGCAETYGRNGVGRARAEKPEFPALPADYLQPEMTPKQSRDGYAVRTGKGSMAGPADTAIGYGRSWATVSNTPFREYKHWTHEGGISTPLIVHWPAALKRRGELEREPSHLIDLLATAVDVARANYPKTHHGGQAIKPMEGVSLAPLFGGDKIEREAIYWEHEGNRAVRKGPFKLVAKGANGPWELYNIDRDRSEQHDLSAERPELVKQLSDMWEAYARRADVLPLNPGAQSGQTLNRKQRRFELANNAALPRDKAPYVANRNLTVTIDANIEGDGVLVAQGGVTHGWAVYVQQGKLRFARTAKGKRAVLSGNAQPQGESHIVARLTKQGQLTLSLNGDEVGAQQLETALTEQPLDGLEVGRDSQGAVGNYEAPFPLQGSVQRVVVEVRP
ncbi:MAG: arylsulfatase [Planctomycetales bacterium]|nr:arylsulfatase [Planctomycetales bacterium]